MSAANDEAVETARAKIYSALLEAQKATRAVELDGQNQHQRYRYATSENVIDEGRLALNSAGLSLWSAGYELGDVEALAPVKGGRPVPERIATVTVTYVLAHESGNSISFRRVWPAIVQSGRELDKAVAGALTTGLAYTLRDLLLMPRDDDKAAMDRRDPPSEERREREPERRPEPQREQERERAPESDRRPTSSEPPLEDLPAEDRGRVDLPASGKEWDELLELVKRGESIAKYLEDSPLKLESRLALAFISRAYKAADEVAFAKIGAEVRKSSDLGHAFKEIVLTEIKPAFAKLQGRAA